MLFLIAFLACSVTIIAGECVWRPEDIIEEGKDCRATHGHFIFQNDGNAVIYDGNDKALWSTTTAGKGHVFRFQDDGNLVLRGRSSDPLWTSNTGRQGGERLVFQDDRNLVIYDKANRAIWSSQTNER